MTSKTLHYKIKNAISNLDEAMGNYYEAETLLHQLAGEKGLSEDDAFRIAFALDKLADFDIHGLKSVIQIVASLERANNYKIDLKNSEAEQQIANLAVLIRKSRMGYSEKDGFHFDIDNYDSKLIRQAESLLM